MISSDDRNCDGASDRTRHAVGVLGFEPQVMNALCQAGGGFLIGGHVRDRTGESAVGADRNRGIAGHRLNAVQIGARRGAGCPHAIRAARQADPHIARRDSGDGHAEAIPFARSDGLGLREVRGGARKVAGHTAGDRPIRAQRPTASQHVRAPGIAEITAITGQGFDRERRTGRIGLAVQRGGG